jgi:hypothetical protein
MKLSSKFGRGRVTALALAGAAGLAGLAVALPPAGAVTSTVTPKAVSVAYTCKTSTGTLKPTVSFVVTAPKPLSKPGSVSLTGFEGTVTISALQLNAASKALGNAAFTIVAKTNMVVNATDAKTAAVKVLKTPETFSIPVKANPTNTKAFTGHLPSKAGTVGPWTASKAGTMTFSAGSITLDVTSPLSETVTCTAATNKLTTVKVG